MVMDQIKPFLQLDYKQFFTMLFIFLMGLLAIYKLIEACMSTFGIETRAQREKREMKAQVDETKRKVEELAASHIKDFTQMHHELGRVVAQETEKFQTLTEKIDKLSNDQIDRNARRDHILAMQIRSDLIQAFQKALKDGYITMSRLHSLTDLYDVYHNILGENSYVTDVFEAVKQLEIVPDGDIRKESGGQEKQIKLEES